MKKVRSIINIVLGSLIAMIGLRSCGEQEVLYGIPIEKYGCPVDTTVHAMYGVPLPDFNAPYYDPETTNEN